MVCQMLLWWTKDPPHSISIGDNNGHMILLSQSWLIKDVIVLRWPALYALQAISGINNLLK